MFYVLNLKKVQMDGFELAGVPLPSWRQRIRNIHVNELRYVPEVLTNHNDAINFDFVCMQK